MAARRRAGSLMIMLALAAMLAALALPPIAQPAAYHDFADRRAWLGTPNFLNVASSLAFLPVGALGLAYALRARGEAGREAWAAFFAGVAATAFGSAYYHRAPDNATLFWDRLPMSVAFMALLTVVIGDRISERAGRRLLLPLIFAGAASVVFWRQTGDLRFYGLVQLFSPLAMLAMLWGLPARRLHARDLLIAAAWYGLAKLFEILDRAVFALGGLISGHTLKHLAAAAACWRILRMMRRAGRVC